MAIPKNRISTLRRAIRISLKAQGFQIHRTGVSFRQRHDKRSIRKRHQLSVAKKILQSERALRGIETELLSYIASGTEVSWPYITPRLYQVQPDTIESALFKYASLHWSIPVSCGYGRRLRFLVFDDFNGKLMGLLGLGDPVYSIKARDEWIGWDSKAKAQRLYHVMDAYVLGAVPPYSRLLAGKLMALATCCDEVRHAFAQRYSYRRSLISGKKRPPHLVMITTASALGRSSLYNRVRFRDRDVFRSVGFTGGWGEFHFSDGVYDRLTDFARDHCMPTAKKDEWGTGFRNRRELVRKALVKLGFSQDLLNHGIQRELFVAPLAQNTREVLRGKHARPRFFRMPFEDAVAFWRNRWLTPRVERDPSYGQFKNEEWRFWPERKRARNSFKSGSLF